MLENSGDFTSIKTANKSRVGTAQKSRGKPSSKRDSPIQQKTMGVRTKSLPGSSNANVRAYQGGKPSYSQIGESKKTYQGPSRYKSGATLTTVQTSPSPKGPLCISNPYDLNQGSLGSDPQSEPHLTYQGSTSKKRSGSNSVIKDPKIAVLKTKKHNIQSHQNFNSGSHGQYPPDNQKRMLEKYYGNAKSANVLITDPNHYASGPHQYDPYRLSRANEFNLANQPMSTHNARGMSDQFRDDDMFTFQNTFHNSFPNASAQIESENQNLLNYQRAHLLNAKQIQTFVMKHTKKPLPSPEKYVTSHSPKK